MPEAEVGIYPDHWHKGRCRVELTAELPFDPSDVETALTSIGYQEIDSDQWGQTYRHQVESQRIAELDEVLFAEPAIKLTLQYGDLEESELDQAKYDLKIEFERIYQILWENPDDWDVSPEQYYFREQEDFRLPPWLAAGPLGY